MKQQGFVLITALLIISILSLVVMSTCDEVLLQYQLQRTALRQQQLFFLAEHGLHEGEQRLQSFSQTHLSVTVDQLTMPFYRITAIAKDNYSDLQVCLQSIYIPLDADLTANNELKSGRQSWVQLNGDKGC
jgi:Tfp pilus assembly protein PilX